MRESTHTRQGTAGRTRRTIVLLLSMLLVLAACGDDGASETPDTEPDTDVDEGDDVDDGSDANGGDGDVEDAAASELEITDITIGILPTPDYAPAVIAVEEGYFADEGLTAETVVMAPGQAVPGIVGGTYDFGGVNWITFVLSVNSGVELHPVIELDRGVPVYAQVLVPESSDIASLEDLAGRDVAVVATPGNCDVLPLHAMQQAGVDGAPNFVNLSIPDMPGALSRGDIDAACVPQPTLGEMLDSGDFRSLLDIFEGDYEGFPIVGMSTSQAFAEQNPATVSAFQRAIQRGAELARQDPDAVRAVLPLYTNFTDEQADIVTLPDYPAALEQERLELTTDIMNQVGIFDDVLDVPHLD